MASELREPHAATSELPVAAPVEPSIALSIALPGSASVAVSSAASLAEAAAAPWTSVIEVSELGTSAVIAAQLTPAVEASELGTSAAIAAQLTPAVEASKPGTSAAVARGSVITFAGYAASLARPVAFALFARTQGASALGALFVIWTSVELGARLATLGLDRGLRRWSGDDRAAATAGALAISAAAGLVVALAVIALLPFLVPLEPAAVWPARLVIATTLPMFAAGSVALRAARGETQIAMFVLARSVVEPTLLLAGGLALGRVLPGTNALLAAFALSIAGASAIAAWTAVRAIGFRALGRALVQPRRWPLRTLVPMSIPLGMADLLQSTQGKLDLVAVALVTYSGPEIAGYAIAATLVSGFTQARQSYEQVIAPIAVELRGRRGELRALLTDGMRWNALIALPMAAALILFPVPLLRLLGGSSDAAWVLIALVVGRTVETVWGPATAMLTVVSHPRLALWSAAIGIAVSLIGDLVLSSLGAAGIAAASSLGAIAAAVVAARWLAQRERIAPRWAALVALPRGLSRGAGDQLALD